MANCCRAPRGFGLLRALAICLNVSVIAAVCLGDPQSVTNNAWRCNGTADGAVCTGTCNRGYTSIPGPTALCTAGTWGAPVGTCTRVCPGAPPTVLGPNATWPSSCTDKTPFLARCTATCVNGTQGSPSIQCGGSSWDTSSYRGRCVSGPACLGAPSAVLRNGRPFSCWDAAAGTICPGTCSTGYGGAVSPSVACVANASSPSGASWASTVTGSCDRVCAGSPPAALLSGVGSWPAHCNGTTPVNGICNANCSGGFGAASIRCGSNGWLLSSFTGGCSNTPVCAGTPSARLENGGFNSSCASTPAGSVCRGRCNSGYGGPTPPTVACQANASSPTGAYWATTASGACVRVCAGAPPAELLLDGTWPASCTSNTPVGTECAANCSNYGAAMITCNNNGWDLTSFIGQCRTTPVCVNAPPTVSNGRFPSSCVGAAVGDSCTAECSAAYQGGLDPVSTCTLQAGTPVWTPPNPGLCLRGTAKNGLAFILNMDANALISCLLRNGKFTECKATDAAVGDAATEPLNGPLGIAIHGQNMWISDTTSDLNARVRVCTWEGQTLKNCKTRSLAFQGAGQVAVNPATSVLYHILNAASCVMTCPNMYTLDKECQCITTPALANMTSFPFGLALGYEHIWITSDLGVTKCPLTPTAFDWEKCNTTELKAAGGNSTFKPSGILVDAVGNRTADGTVYLADGSASMLVCDGALAHCVQSFGNDTFASGPGLTGIAVSGGILYVPLLTSPTPALSVCSRPADAAGCTLSLWATNPPKQFKGTVNVVVVPPPAKKRLQL